MRSSSPLLLALLGWLYACPAFATLSVDTSSTSTGTSAAATVTLAATNTNEVIVLYAVQLGSTTSLSTVTDSCGKTWARRTKLAWGAFANEAEEWYTTSTGVYSCTITATFGTSATWRLLAFGVNGANLTTPWDVNVSLPANNTTTSATTLSPSAAISTTAANTMLLTFFRAQGGAGTLTNPSGFSTAASGGASEQAAYNVVPTTQSGIAPQWSWTTGSQNAVGIWDAIQAASGGGGSTDNGIFMGVP